ncbi:MAG: hypothetical protein ACE5FN_10485 [Leptospirillia bacterium]
MPDLKYGDNTCARTYSKIKNYVTVNRAAVREMHRQVGNLVLDPHGIARRGLLVRHLVLPNGLSGTRQVLEFIARELSPNTYVNLMDQYYPAYRAGEYPPLIRPLTQSEFQSTLDAARALGITRLDSIHENQLHAFHQ